MSNQNEKTPTTFGVTIERKSGISPAHTGNSQSNVESNSIPSTTAPSATRSYSPIDPLHSSPVNPRLHLTSNPNIAEPALPSPFSIPDSPHDRATDLEAGTYEPHNAPAVPEPTASTLVAESIRPMTPARQISSASTVSSSTAGQCVTGNEKLVDGRVRECTMWPTQTSLKQKAKAEKKKRSRNPFLRLSKRNKVIVSVAIALTVIGGAIGIGVGVSRAYHGEVWVGNGKNVPLPQ